LLLYSLLCGRLASSQVRRTKDAVEHAGGGHQRAGVLRHRLRQVHDGPELAGGSDVLVGEIRGRDARVTVGT